MAIFNSYVSHNQRVNQTFTDLQSFSWDHSPQVEANTLLSEAPVATGGGWFLIGFDGE